MKLRLALVLPVLAFFLAFAPNALADAPANDDFADATLITPAETNSLDDAFVHQTAPASNADATAEAGEANHAGSTPAHSVWFSWAAPANGTARFYTCNSTFDTVLSVYTSSDPTSPALANLTSVGEDDNLSCGSAEPEVSVVEIHVTAGQKYFAAVDGASATDTGNVVFAVAFGASAANDDFADRETLSATNASAAGNNLNASHETGEPNHDGEDGVHSVWYEWTAPSSGTFTADVCDANYDSVLAVYTGTSVDALTPVASNDDACGTFGSASSVPFNATAGTRYEIAVDGFGTAEGHFTLRISPPPGVTTPPGTTPPDTSAAPPPDLLAPALTLTLGSGTLKSVLKKGFGLTFGCNKACTAKFQLLLARKTAKKFHLAKAKKPIVVGKGSSKLTTAGTNHAVVKLTKKAKKRFKKLKKGKKVKLTLVTTVTGANGKQTVKKKPVTLKR